MSDLINTHIYNNYVDEFDDKKTSTIFNENIYSKTKSNESNNTMFLRGTLRHKLLQNTTADTSSSIPNINNHNDVDKINPLSLSIKDPILSTNTTQSIIPPIQNNINTEIILNKLNNLEKLIKKLNKKIDNEKNNLSEKINNLSNRIDDLVEIEMSNKMQQSYISFQDKKY